ncbi:hypothetical protein SAY87_018003 [Trapa incisa]|uniref:Uncharacterized protein n=1 Tax=Trapa incisa TaxID=236973 RepID=A0AAN7LAZ4_9MYRT|nr:hypothetical protein SAY87_018003 [Trapa incisa]
MTPRRQAERQQSGVLYELSALVLDLLRSPQTLTSFPGEMPLPAPPVESSCPSSSRRPPPQQITLAGLAALLLGASLTLMLCGSITFFVGFMMMPWVFGLVVVIYLARIVSALSVLSQSIIGFAAGPPDHPTKIHKS